MRRRFGLFLFLLIFLFLAPRLCPSEALCEGGSFSEVGILIPQVFAQDTGWVIDSFHAELVIMKTGEVVMAEDIAIDFGTLEKHGIYRDLPVVYDLEGQPYYTEINVDAVLQDERGAKYEIQRNENNLRIKIGDGNKTISGKHTYHISYTAKGILRGFETYDELYWNVTGNEWGVPINKATARVKMQEGSILQITCFQGYATYTEGCQDETSLDKTVATYAATRLLQPHEGLTIVTGYEKGVIPLITVPKPKSFGEKMLETNSLLFLGIMLIGAVSTAFFLWLRNGRDYSFIRRSVLDDPSGERLRGIGENETVVVEYEPPEKLRPAEIGVLTDERADTLDVVATIIDLAARGYLTITEVPKKWVFGSTDYTLKMKNFDASGLLHYETLLFDKLFDGKKEVKVSSLKRTFYEDLAQVKKALYERVVTQKLFPKNPESMRVKYLIIGIILGAIGFFVLTNGISRESVFVTDFGIGLLATGLFLLILSPFMSRRSAHGRELFRRVSGYQLFIASAEKYRQRFFEKKNLFNEVLPYAILFGLTAKFAQAMKDIGLPEKYMASGWYYGTHPFNYASFNSSMNSFAISMSSAIASAPKSSGFSSGGSSGGGFGGGGGGSW